MHLAWRSTCSRVDSCLSVAYCLKGLSRLAHTQVAQADRKALDRAAQTQTVRIVESLAARLQEEPHNRIDHTGDHTGHIDALDDLGIEICICQAGPSHVNAQDLDLPGTELQQAPSGASGCQQNAQ